MNILILQGPNMNLLGVMSAQAGRHITLDKINKDLRRHNRNSGSELKIFQTHKVFQALNFIQRNRNWADGILFAPMAWALYEHSLREAIEIVDTPTVQLLFNTGYGTVNTAGDSIFTAVCKETCIGFPDEVFIRGHDILHSQN